MDENFKLITEQNKFSLNKPQDNNVVYYSELNEWFTTNAFRSFSLKYVLEGAIQYKTERNQYTVEPGALLLASKQPGVKAYFESAKTVRSICIDICPATLNEVFSLLTAKNERNFEEFSNGFYKEAFFTEKYTQMNTFKGASVLIHLLSQSLNNHENKNLTTEWFYQLAEHIVCNEYESYISQSKLPFSKISTRNEIYKRLLLARDYMDGNFLQIKSNKEISSKCMLSEYHFIRSFRQVYNLTPYQYLLQRRLTKACELIMEGGLELRHIALYCGFTDIATFSKAFKRVFKIPPSRYKPEMPGLYPDITGKDAY